MTNKTSEAVEDYAALCSRNGGTQNGDEGIGDDEFLAIAEKYKRMEQALKKISRISQDYSGQIPEVAIADDALAFDPLNSSSPNSL